MDDGTPTLEVGFAIDAGGSFDTLGQLDRAIDSATANAIAEFAKIEKASSGMINLGGATASVKVFGEATTRAARDAARELAKVERTGETLVRQLERQNAAFGKTRDELRSMRAEEAALAAERVGNSDLAMRIRAQEQALYDQEFAAARRARQEAEAAAEERAIAAQRAASSAEMEAKALREAAFAHQMFEARVRQGAAALREQEAAQKAIQRDQAATAMRVEANAAARLADEHARIAREVHASRAAQEADAASLDRLRQEVDPLYGATKRLNQAIEESTRLYYAGMTPQAEYAQQQAVLQGRLRVMEQQHDATARATARSAHSMSQLSFQLNDVVTMAALGAPPMQIFFSQFGQIAQIAQTAEGGVRGFAQEVGSMALRFGPLIAVTATAVGAFALFDRAVSKGVDTKAMIDGLGLTRAEIKRLKDTSVDAGDVVTATFQVLARNVGISLDGISTFFDKSLDTMTTVGRKWLAMLYAEYVGTFRAIGAIVSGVFAGKGISEILSDVGDSYTGAFKEADDAMLKFGQDVTAQIGSNKLAELQKKAKEIKADRRPDRHADQLAREAAATERQITNLLALADAYRVSGAAALVAEARAKAESEAIKKRGDIEAAVDRQVRLVIAQRVADAERGAASTREQAIAQEAINAQVAAGLVPAQQAAQLVRERIEDMTLLSAIEAARLRRNDAATRAAIRALEDQRAARDRLRSAETAGQFNTDMAAGADRLAILREEMRLIGAVNAERVHAIALLRATQEAAGSGRNAEQQAAYIAQQVQIADLEYQRQLRADAFNASLRFQSDLVSELAANVQVAAQGMSEAFGRVGDAIGGVVSSFADYIAGQARLDAARRQELEVAKQIKEQEDRTRREREIGAVYAARNAQAQVGLFGDMAMAAKGFFKEGSDGYQVLAGAEKAFRTVQFALSLRAIAQDAIETASSIANSGARTAAGAVEAVVSAIKSLPFPLNLAAGAATVGALASLGISIAGSFGGNKNRLAAANDGTGTVFGDGSAKSESLQRSIDALREVDTITSVYAREMAASLKSIDSQIGNLAAVVVRAGDINADTGIKQGFKSDAFGSTLNFALDPGGIVSKIPVLGDIVGGIGDLLGGLFGTKTKVIGSGLFQDARSIGDILAGGFDAQTYSDVQKSKKFLGVSTSKKYSTAYGELEDDSINQQFTLLLKSFNDAILASADPLGVATAEIAHRVSGFVFDLGKIDLKGLTGEEVQEKLAAVFGAAADDMARAGFPQIERFQKVGEGAFETLVRVASTVEAVTNSLDLLGLSVQGLGIDAKVGIADRFDSVSAMASASDAFFTAYYSKQEQAAARTQQFARLFDSLGIAMPSSIGAFRQLVEAQNLTTDAGRATYATLLQLAPAFAELQTSMLGAKSAADILAEREDLQRELLEAQGNTAAIRALDLAKLDTSNRALQEQIWAMQDAKVAADAANELRDAWKSVGDGIMEEVNRIRGLSDTGRTTGFAALMGQFNAATSAARGGDQDAAKSLPGLSQALLQAAAQAATSRQELDRVRAQAAASLEATYGVISQFAGGRATNATDATLAVASSQVAAGSPAAGNDMVTEIRGLRAEVAQLRFENNSGHAATAGASGRVVKILDDVTAASSGQAVSVA